MVSLRFSLFGIPVEVRPSFLLVAALLGLSTNRVSLIFAWMLVLFVSILIHEVGHAVTARSMGAEVEIQLNGIGGLTTWAAPDGDVGPGKRALVAGAGSAYGLAFGGLVWLLAATFAPFAPDVDFVLDNLVRVNVFWGLLNWLPIRPLDGGHLLTSLLERFAPVHGERVGNAVFFLTAALALVAGIRFELIFVALISAWLLWGELTRGREKGENLPLPNLDFDSPTKEIDSGIEVEHGEHEDPADTEDDH